MGKKIGMISENKLCFLDLTVTAEISTGKIDVDIKYDSRVVKNEEKLKEITSQFYEQIEKIMCEK